MSDKRFTKEEVVNIIDEKIKIYEKGMQNVNRSDLAYTSSIAKAVLEDLKNKFGDQMRNPDGIEFTFILMMLAFGCIIFCSLGVPFIANHMVGENATWIFHNEIVEEKWIEQTSSGFLNLGDTKYYVKTTNRTFEVDGNFYHDIYPKSYLGYWVNNETGEITTSWHVQVM